MLEKLIEGYDLAFSNATEVASEEIIERPESVTTTPYAVAPN